MCIQCWTNGSPVAASDCARSHSWCGKMRSVPPPWRWIVEPSSRSARALHSMCQPGRPGPHSVSHDGSSGADGCHRTKSSGSRLSGLSTSPPRCAGELEHLFAGVVADGAEAVELGHVEEHAAARLVGVAAIDDHADEPADVGDRRRRPRPRRHGQGVERLHVRLEASLLPRRQVEVVHAELAGLGEQRIVDVGDVAHARHAVAEVDQPALQHVVGEVRRRMAEVGGVVRRDPARVHQHVLGRLERHHRLAGGVVEPQGHRGWRRGSRLMPVSFGATRVL